MKKLMGALILLSAAIFAAGCSSPGDQSGTTAAQAPLTQAQQVQVTGAILNTVANAAGLPVIQVPSGASGAADKVMKAQLDLRGVHQRNTTSFSVAGNCDVSGTLAVTGTISDNSTSDNYNVTASFQVVMHACVSSDGTEIDSSGFAYGLTLTGGTQVSGASTTINLTYAVTLDGSLEIQNSSSGIVDQLTNMNLTEQLALAETINSATGTFSETVSTSINGEIGGENYANDSSSCTISGNQGTSAYASSGTCVGF